MDAILFLAGGLGLAGLPPFGTLLGKGMIEDAAEKLGYAWVTVVLLIASALTGGAVLRATGRVFAGWGPRRDDQEEASARGDEKPEPQERETHTPPSLLAPAMALMLVGVLLGLQPGLGSRVEVAAARFEDRPAYTAAVLGGRAPAPPVGPLAPAGPDVSQVVSGLVSSAGAVGIALVWLFRTRLSETLRRRTWRIVSVGVKPLHAVHVAQLSCGALVDIGKKRRSSRVSEPGQQ